MSDKKVSDEAISRAAEILLKGAKMLSFHCPECKMPLFEKDAKVFCVSCDKDFEIVEVEGKKILKEVLKEGEVRKVAEEIKEKEVKVAKIQAGQNSIILTIENAAIKVAEMIVSSKNTDEICKLTDSLEKIVCSLEKVKKLYN